MAAAATAKVKVDLNPTGPITFWWPVDIPTHERKTLTIEFLFKHRTKKQLAELQRERFNRARVKFDELQAKAKAERDKAAAERKAFEEARRAAEEAGEEPPEEEVKFPETPDFEQQAHDEIANCVEGLLELAEDWNIDGIEFNADNLALLCDKHGAAAESINQGYGEALSKGRLGNSKR